MENWDKKTDGGISKPRLLLFAFLMIVSIGGVAVMDFSASYALWYWLGTCVVFAITSIGIAWQDSLHSDEERSPQVRRQLVHWAIITIGILMIFLLERMEHLDPRSGGLISLLILTIGALLAGIHFFWRMSLLGLLLLFTFAAAVFAEQFFWIMLVPGIVLGAYVVFRSRSD